MTGAEELVAGLGTVRGWQEDCYRDLHRHPELSHQEHRTAAKVAGRLRRIGYQVHEGVGGTGVVGALRNGDGPTVLLRADMDALPVREATSLPYASTATATGPDGDQVPVAHACGHDAHMACLLGAAALLAGGTDRWSGTLVALFQPAEETGDGAKGMVDDGLAGLASCSSSTTAIEVAAVGPEVERYQPAAGEGLTAHDGNPVRPSPLVIAVRGQADPRNRGSGCAVARDVIVLIGWLSRLDDAELDARGPRLLWILVDGLRAHRP